MALPSAGGDLTSETVGGNVKLYKRFGKQFSRFVKI